MNMKQLADKYTMPIRQQVIKKVVKGKDKIKTRRKIEDLRDRLMIDRDCNLF